MADAVHIRDVHTPVEQALAHALGFQITPNTFLAVGEVAWS